jgi:leucyl-tRNA synthetase
MTKGTDKEETEQLALAAPKVQSYLEGRQIRKVVVVPERLVNIVCGYIQRIFTPLTAEVAVS